MTPQLDETALEAAVIARLRWVAHNKSAEVGSAFDAASMEQHRSLLAKYPAEVDETRAIISAYISRRDEQGFREMRVGQSQLFSEADRPQSLPDVQAFPDLWMTDEQIPREVKLIGNNAWDPDVYVASFEGEHVWVMKHSGRIIRKSDEPKLYAYPQTPFFKKARAMWDAQAKDSPDAQ